MEPPASAPNTIRASGRATAATPAHSARPPTAEMPAASIGTRCAFIRKARRSTVRDLPMWPEVIISARVKPPRTNRVLISALLATSPRLMASSSFRSVGSSVWSSLSGASAMA
jgi:hypothetical protein